MYVQTTLEDIKFQQINLIVTKVVWRNDKIIGNCDVSLRI